MILRLQEITKDREDKMNGLWTEFQQVLRNYADSTEEKYAEYVEMRNKDNADTKEIHQHYLEVAKATRDISLLKSVLEAQSTEHHIHMNQLNQYKELLKEKQTKLKTAMNSSEKTHKKLIKTLVVSSTEINTVNVIERFGNHLLGSDISLFFIEIGQFVIERKKYFAIDIDLQQI